MGDGNNLQQLRSHILPLSDTATWGWLSRSGALSASTRPMGPMPARGAFPDYRNLLDP